MRRLISILFLVVFLFNVGGYYLVFWGMEMKAKQNLLSRLEADDYTSEEIVILTIPLTLPYPIYSGGYERVDGEFQHQGEYYKLVKQKVDNDTLFIVCVRDRESTKLANALSDYTKVAHNLPVGSKQALSFLAKLYKDFNTTEFKIFYRSRLLFDQTYYAQASPSLLDCPYLVESPPPENRF